LYDLGVKIPKVPKLRRKNINRVIQQFDRRFDLVMMTERFEESLILLKDIACLEYEDIIYAVINRRGKKPYTSQKVRKDLKKHLRYEYALYDFFKQKFEKKVLAFGKENMEEELKLLKHYQRMENHHCSCVTTGLSRLTISLFCNFSVVEILMSVDTLISLEKVELSKIEISQFCQKIKYF